jgi:hypothetical protein
MNLIKLLTIIPVVFLVSCNQTVSQKTNPADITIACYYFPDYHTDDPRNIINKGPGWSEWELVKKAVPRFPRHKQPNIPAWGYTDEKDPEVMAQKISAAAKNGIDCFIFDWYMYEDGPFLNRCIDEGFLKANNCDSIKFGLMWANHDWVDIHPYTRGAEQKLLYPGEVSPERFDEISDLVIKEYFTLPNYWKIDGKAYFSVYDVQKFVKGFVTMGWDASPRCSLESEWANVGYPFMNTITNNTPENFKKALQLTREKLLSDPTGPRILNINCWNEWTEGSYLEPDVVNGMSYLEAIKEVFK